MDAELVADILFTRAKLMGSIVFLIVLAIAVFTDFSHRDEKIPSTALGCYRSDRAPNIVVSTDRITIDQDDIGAILLSYRLDNVGHAILTNKPLLLKPLADRRYKFFVEDRVGRYVRLLPGPPPAMEITASDGMVVSYSHVACGVVSGTKTR